MATTASASASVSGRMATVMSGVPGCRAVQCHNAGICANTRRLSPASASGAGMGGLVDLQQVLGVDLGVALGGGERGVPQQLLDGPQVAAGPQQVGGEGMAQGMRGRG